jgi:hypothetical protein
MQLSVAFILSSLIFEIGLVQGVQEEVLKPLTFSDYNSHNFKALKYEKIKINKTNPK